MMVDQVYVFFVEEVVIVCLLQLLQEIGLGYLWLGQLVMEFLGGEV